MKRGLSFIFAVTVAIATLSARETKLSDSSALPEDALSTIETYYSNIDVENITVNQNSFGKRDYDVVLGNGTEMEFDKSGSLKEINCGKSEVPQGLVIQPIRDFVKRNFEEQIITSIEFKRKGYEVELSNGVDISFDQTGKFRGIN